MTARVHHVDLSPTAPAPMVADAERQVIASLSEETGVPPEEIITGQEIIDIYPEQVGDPIIQVRRVWAEAPNPPPSGALRSPHDD